LRRVVPSMSDRLRALTLQPRRPAALSLLKQRVERATLGADAKSALALALKAKRPVFYRGVVLYV
jgi:hypothetical protein